jgi:O-antigen/teichoic acid export membrane protein
LKHVRTLITSSRRVSHRNPEAFWSIVTALLIQGTVIVSGILVARTLGAENRGHLQLLSLMPVIIGQLGFLGLPLAVTYYIARNPGHQRQILRSLHKKLALATAGLVLLHAAILAAVFWDASAWLRLAALTTLVAGPGALAQVYGLAILQGQQRFGAFNAMRALQVATYSSFVVAAFVMGVRDLGPITAAWSLSVGLSGAVIMLVALLPGARSPAVEDEEPPSFRRMQAFGLKSLVGWTNLFESFRLDQIVVGAFIGPKALGLYVVGLALTNLPRFIAQSIGMVAYPRVASAPGRQTRLTIKYMALTLVICGTIVASMEALCGFLIPNLFGAEFGGAVGITRILLLSALFMSLKRVLNDCARGLGRPDFGLQAECASWLPLLPGFFLIGDSAAGVAWILVASSLTGLGVLATRLTLARASERGLPGERPDVLAGAHAA